MRMRICSAATLVVMQCAAIGAVQPPLAAAQGVGWIGLYTAELVDWLENENRLGTLCSAHRPESQPWHACREQYLLPKVRVLRLRKAPPRPAALAGDLIVEAMPGRGLRAYYVPAEGGAAVPFVPDILDGDWSYGPFFEHSIVEQRGSWVRLPEEPLPKGTWLDISALGPGKTPTWLQPEDIVESPQGDLFVLGVTEGRVRARPEQERDMWCDSSETRPALSPFREVTLGPSDLYTATGHLRLRLKYTRGC